MTGKEFIFSVKVKPRLARHLAFWILFYLQTVLVTIEINGVSDFFNYGTYRFALISAALLLPVCLWSVYASLFILFPLLKQKRSVLFITCFFLLIAINCLIELGFYLYTRPYTCVRCGTGPRIDMINTALSLGINVAGLLGVIALGIKFTKSWYQQQINNRMLARQKISNELKLLKARIQPDFLFETLQALQNKIESDRRQAAKIMLKFSELLSYTLYECDEDFIAAERVVQITKEFVVLKKATMKTTISGMFPREKIGKKYIPSFAVLPLLQQSISIVESHTSKVKTVAIEVSANRDLFQCDIYIQTDCSSELMQEFSNAIDLFRRRLETLYEKKYTIEISEMEQGFSISLSLVLSEMLMEKETNKMTGSVYETTVV